MAPRRTWWIAFGLAVFLIAPPLLIGIRSYRAQAAAFFPPRVPVETPPESSGIAGLHEVGWKVGDLALRGWYAPPRSGAAVILCHGAGGNRAALLVEARALSGAGFGILTFDWPGHGNSTGESRWSEPEREGLSAALDWLGEQPGVDKSKIGAYGFSMGGYILAQVAGRDHRIAALALAGTPSDPIEQLRFAYRRWGWFGQLPAQWALLRRGMQIEYRRPVDVIADVAPRPLLIIAGTDDGIVPRFMAEQLYAAASAPKELYVISGAHHGDYAEVAPGNYEQHVVNFFARALSGTVAR